MTSIKKPKPITKDVKKLRKCLGHTHEEDFYFMSKGVHNRICEKCAIAAPQIKPVARLSDPDYRLWP